MNQRDYVTIVTGLPRSGTSMAMRMIHEGGIPALVDNVRQPDEDNPKGYFEFEPVKKTKDDASWVPLAIGKLVKMVHLIVLDLPLDVPYRVVFMRRNLDEVIQSQNVMLERHSKSTGSGSVGRLKEIFLLQIDKVKRFMEDHADHFRYIEVSYNEVLRDPDPSLERISTLLGGLDTTKMQAVIDASLYRNRNPKD